MEVEGEFVKLLRDLHQKPVLPLGLLAPSREAVGKMMINEEEMFAWLDMQKIRSVVYVAFGSEATLSLELLHELALGLELLLGKMK